MTDHLTSGQSFEEREESRRRRRDAFAAKVGPHKRVGEVRTVDVPAGRGVAAHRDFLVTTACEQEVSTTLATCQDERVRCPNCKRAVVFKQRIESVLIANGFGDLDVTCSGDTGQVQIPDHVAGRATAEERLLLLTKVANRLHRNGLLAGVDGGTVRISRQ